MKLERVGELAQRVRDLCAACDRADEAARAALKAQRDARDARTAALSDLHAAADELTLPEVTRG